VAVGAAVGFLPYNFYPAKIFMGDSGSMLLGVLLAAATISGVGQTIQPSGGDIAAFSIPVLIPLIVLAVPLADVGMAVIRRLRRHRPIFAPDKEHLHHQLREIGHTHRQAVLLMYFWSLLLVGSALAVTFINGRAILTLILVTAVTLIGLTFIPRRIRESRRARRERGEAQEAPAETKPA
jgi:UDP-GlcNAc:undecaprenyl-phosphate GlcNAc-1-phosphate transferase